MISLTFIALLLITSGFIFGLGAVTVIDIHGLLGRKSPYWTEATTRTHKVTKPLIWIGIFLLIIGGTILYRNEPFQGLPLYHSIIAITMIINGLFLSFYVSPYLLERESEGRQSELLPTSLQKKIVISFIMSLLGWWGSLVLFVYYVTNLIN